MTKARFIPGIKKLPIEKPIQHRPARMTLWTMWFPLKKVKQNGPDIGVFAPEYQGTPMLFPTKKEAKEYIGWPGTRGVPVKVTLRFSSGQREEKK